MANLGIATVQNMGQAVETLSGGQRQAVAVARAATFASKFVVLDEPTAALGVKETGQVLNLIQQIRAKGLPVILISHNMPNVFEVADRIHIARLGGCAGVITPKSHTPDRGRRDHDRRDHARRRAEPGAPVPRGTARVRLGVRGPSSFVRRSAERSLRCLASGPGSGTR